MSWSAFLPQECSDCWLEKKEEEALTSLLLSSAMDEKQKAWRLGESHRQQVAELG